MSALEMPVQCDCGKIFDLEKGHACRKCCTVSCVKCLKTHFGLCKYCKGQSHE